MFPAGKFLLKVIINSIWKNASYLLSRKMSKMFLNLVKKITDQRYLLRSGVFGDYFKQVFQIVLVTWLILDKFVVLIWHCVFKKLKLYRLFLWKWFNCLKATEPLRGDSSLLTTQSPGALGTHFIDLGRMTGWVDRGVTTRFWAKDLWLGNPEP